MFFSGKSGQEKGEGTRVGFIFKLYSLRVPICESYGEIGGGAYSGKIAIPKNFHTEAA
jgi:hypothetical protein